jgi:hypothetical protein
MVGSLCVKVPITRGELDPVLPTALHRSLTPSDWEVLANVIAAALLPAAKFNESIECTHMATFLGIVACLFFLFLVPTYRGLQGDDFEPGFPFMEAAFILIIIMHMSLMARTRPTVDVALRDGLHEFAQQKAVTFHLTEAPAPAQELQRRHGPPRFFPRYLCIDFVLEITVGEEGYRLASSQGVVGDVEGGHSIEERLRKLESAGPLLSEEEYSEKRRATLDSL